MLKFKINKKIISEKHRTYFIADIAANHDGSLSRAKKLIKLLERLVKQEHLYTDEKIKEMKEQLRSLKKQFSELEAKTSKGFGKK
jgi:N-acetylneuraminate synthase